MNKRRIFLLGSYKKKYFLTLAITHDAQILLRVKVDHCGTKGHARFKVENVDLICLYEFCQIRKP